VDKVNVGSRALVCPYLYCDAREGHTTMNTASAPIREHEEMLPYWGYPSPIIGDRIPNRNCCSNHSQVSTKFAGMDTTQLNAVLDKDNGYYLILCTSFIPKSLTWAKNCPTCS
jgi:hypothetical protein